MYNIDTRLPVCVQDEYRQVYYNMEADRVNATTAVFNQQPVLHAEYNQVVDCIVAAIENCDAKDGTVVFEMHRKFPLDVIWKDERIWQAVFKKHDYVLLEYLIEVMPGPPTRINGIPFVDYMSVDSFVKENFIGFF